MTTVETRKTLKFTKMCKHFSTKRCFMGNECNFAHSQEELRSRPDLAATGLCYQFMSKGQCKRGAACTFAHGKKELREIPEDVLRRRDVEAAKLRATESGPASAATSTQCSDDSTPPSPILAPTVTSTAMAPVAALLPPLPTLLPTMPTMPLLPIDDLMLSAGLALPMRPPPGLPPPPVPSAAASAAAVSLVANAAALHAAMSVLTAEKLKAVESALADASPTTASLESLSTSSDVSEEERHAEPQDSKIGLPPGLCDPAYVWL